MSPRGERGVYSVREDGSDAIGTGVTVMPFHEVLPAQDLDSSVASLFRNDMGLFEIDSKGGDRGIFPNGGSFDRA